MTPAQMIRPAPSGRLSFVPYEAFFSIAMMTSSISIQPTLPVPATNISNMIAQQHLTQNSP